MVVGVGAGMLSTGFLMPEIGWFNLQGVSVNERDFSAPLDHVNVDIEISKQEGFINGVSFFKNNVNACSFHTPDATGLGPGSTVICKLTDDNGFVVAEGRADFANGLDKSERTLIPIDMTAFDGANEIQNINDIKLIVLGGDPTSHMCNQLMFDTCIDFDGVATSGRGLEAASQESFLGAPIASVTGVASVDGLYWYDSDGDGIHDIGWDSLTVGENTGACATAINSDPNELYDLGADCVVVDISNMLQDQDTAEADLEDGLLISGPGFPTFSFHDDNGNGQYDAGEDIFIDGKSDGIIN